MAKFKESFNSFSDRELVSESVSNKTAKLYSLIGKDTRSVFLPTPIDETKGNVQQFNYIRSAFKRIWDKMFGDGITSQFIANTLFEQFLTNFPKAEKLLIEWICGKLNIPISPTLTPELVDALNGLIDNEIEFASEFQAMMLAAEKPFSTFKKIALWINSALKFLYTFKWSKS